MAKLDTLDRLLHDELKDIYSAENQLTKALPKMAKQASSEELREAIASHLEETKGQIERLDKIASLLDIKLTGKKCKAMEGLIEEAKELMEEDGEPAILDAAMIGAAQKVEHYEMAAYGTARALAEQLGHSEIAELLQETLDEESAADEKLTEVATSAIYPAIGSGEEEEEEEEMEATGSKG